jgi:hypothetical protein
MMNVVTLAKKHEEEEVTEGSAKSREQIFRKVLIKTIISWAEESVSRIFIRRCNKFQWNL